MQVEPGKILVRRVGMIRPRTGRPLDDRVHPIGRRDDMGSDDKLKNTTDSKLGSAKEKIGDATGNEDMQAEGKADQAKADLKQAGEKVKDVFK
jgi:uncharacterized protein YjbJ (UPF0337 family)